MRTGLARDPYAAQRSYYDRWAATLGDADIRFFARESARVPTVVELGVGTGRVAVPVARAGTTVIGVDRSEAMLCSAAAKAAAAGVAARVGLVCADMRSFVCGDPVRLITIPCRSFMHLVTAEDQLQALDACRRSLAPGGRLIVTLLLPDDATVASMQGARRHQLDFVGDDGRLRELWSEHWYARAEQLLRIRSTVETIHAGRVVDTASSEMTLRVVQRYEMEHLFARAGFDVEALYGNYDRSPYTDECREMIWIARRR